jgi:hypothetical protein
MEGAQKNKVKMYGVFKEKYKIVIKNEILVKKI